MKRSKLQFSKSIHGEYVELLEVILDNAIKLKKASAQMLKRKELRPFYQFLLFTAIEECGKFLLVKDAYPRKLTKSLLMEIGFYDHKKKIRRVVKNLELEYGEINPTKLNLENKMIDNLKRNLRENSLYIDYDEKNRKPVSPTFITSAKALQDTVIIIENLIKFCYLKLAEFKKTPILKHYKFT